MRRWASLLVLVAVSAWGSQHVNQMPSGINWSKWGLAVGKVNCHELDPTAQDGDTEYCSPSDGGPGCIAGSDPCACASDGTDASDVFAYRDHGRWRCDAGGGACTNCADLDECPCVGLGQACTKTLDCCTGFCQGGVCTAATTCTCVGVGESCTSSGNCCEGFCRAGVCELPTTTTTTSSTTSTT